MRRTGKRKAERDWLGHPVTKKLAVEAATAFGGPAAGAAVGFAHHWWKPSGSMGNYGQGTYTQSRRKYGRQMRRNTNKYTRKLVNAARSKFAFQVTKYTQFGTGYGSYQLRNYLDTRALTDTTGGYYMPCHLWDVTAVCNNTLASDTFVNGQCGYRIGLDSTGTGAVPRHRTLGPTLDVVNGPGVTTSTQATLRSGSILRGVRAKLLFYCPTTIPVRVRVSLIQLLDQRYHPSKNTLGVSSGYTDLGNAQADNTLLPNDDASAMVSAAAFWQQVNNSFTRNPVEIGAGNLVRRYMKVLRKEEFVLNPKESTDATATTYHMLDLYHKFNRYQNYQWEDYNRQSMVTDDSYANQRGLIRPCVQPRARIYLMIQADGKYSSGAADPPVDDSANSCSYDIALRMYHDDIV